MKISCNREKFFAAFQTAASVAPSRSPKPILTNVKLDVKDGKAELSATDMETGIRIEATGVDVEAPGSVVLPIDRFGSILRESRDETLRLEVDGQATMVYGQRSQFRLPSEKPEEFPTVAAFTDAEYFEVPSRLLREMVRRTIFATDNEGGRYALGGVLLEVDGEALVAVGTDGRRLAKMQGPIGRVGAPKSPDQHVIVPTRSMQLIERALTDGDAEVHLAMHENNLLVRSPRATIYTTLLSGRFPKWRDVFPDSSRATRIEFTVGPLHSAVRQAMIVTSEDSKGVDFTFGDGNLVLAAQTADKGQSRVELPISYDAAPITITLDPRYVSEFLKVLDAEKTFTLELFDGDSAAVCKADDGYGYVIMPLAKNG